MPDELSVITYVGYFCNKNSVAKADLLQWLQERLPQFSVTDFTLEWKDAIALGCLVDVVSGGQFPEYEDMTPDDPLDNATRSMDFAKEKLSVPKVITPEQFIDPSLDPLPMMTYLTYFKAVKTSGLSTDNIIAAGPGIKGDKAGKETNFVVRGRVPGWASLDVAITGPSGENVVPKKTPPVANSCAVRYTPPQAGNYTVSVQVDKKHITGSPFTVRHIEPANASTCGASGMGLEKGIVGEKAEFKVDCISGGTGSLQIEIKGPSGNIGTDVAELSDRNYAVNFIPNEAGSHTVNILWAGTHVQGSPFTTQVVDPKKCFASGKGLTTATVGEPATFNVATNGAGQAKLSATVEGPSGPVPLQTREDGPNNYVCTYTPEDAGEHTVNIKWAGIPIPSSPFATRVIDPKKCIASGKGHTAVVGEPATLNITTKDAGQGKLSATVEGPSGPIAIKIREAESDNYICTYIPQCAGKHTVDVKWADLPINGSPFATQAVDPKKCFASGKGLVAANVGEPATFNVATKDAGQAKLSLTIEGPSGPVPVQVHEDGPNNYVCTYTPQDAGKHTINIKWADLTIPSSPFTIHIVDPKSCFASGKGLISASVGEPATFNVATKGTGQAKLSVTVEGPNGPVPIQTHEDGSDNYVCTYTPQDAGKHTIDIKWAGLPIPSSPFTTRVVDPKKCLASGKGLESAILGEPATFNVATSGAGQAKISATIEGPSGPVPVQVREDGPDNYVCTYTPQDAGKHTINIKWADLTIPSSPFTIHIVDPKSCFASGKGLISASVGEPATFNVATKGTGQAKLLVTVEGPNGPVPIQAHEDGSDNYVCTYTPQDAGKHTIDIKWAGLPIPSSPFTTRVVDPKKCLASGKGLESAIVGEPATFNVATNGAGQAKLSVTVQGPSGQIFVQVHEDNPNNYICTYTPQDAGEHVIGIKWADLPIPNSPFTTQVVDPKKCFASGKGLTTAKVGEPATFNVATNGAGQAKLSATVEGPSGPVPVQTREDGPNNYACTYTPEKAGQHTINIKWADLPIPSSPFHVVSTVPIDVGQVKIRDVPAGRLRAGKEVKFVVETQGAGDGEITASGQGTSLAQKCKLVPIDSASQYVVFSPFEVGSLTINVLFAGQPVSGSPLYFSVNDPTKCHVNATAIEKGEYFINESVDFKVSTQFAGEGNLAAVVHGPKGEKDANIEKQDEDTYLIKFAPKDAGPHGIDIFFDGEQIPDAPVRLFVKPSISANDVIVTQPAPSRMSVFVVNTPYEYKINAAGATKEELSVTASGVRTGSKPKVTIEDHHNDHYSIFVETSVSDEYKINIKWGGYPVPGSSFSLSTVNKVKADKTKVKGPVYRVGSPAIALELDATEAGAGELSASCYGKRAGDVPIKPINTDPGVYSINITTPKPDLYTVSVMWSDEHVPGSPYKVNLIPPDASKIIVTKPDTYGLSMRAVFKVDATEAGVGKLASFCRAENTSNLPVEINKADPNVEVYQLVVTPIKEDTYRLSVLWSGTEVPDSPFEMNLVPKVQSDRVIVSDPVYSMVESPVTVKVDCSKAGRGNLTTSCTGDSYGNVPVETREVEKGKYEVKFIPKEADDYHLSIFFNGQGVPRSPLNIPIHPIRENIDFVVYEPPVETGNFDMLPLEKPPPPKPTMMDMYIGDPLSIDIDDLSASESEPHLVAKAIGDKNGPTDVAIIKVNKEKYRLAFNPLRPDRYVIKISRNGSPLPSTPIIAAYTYRTDGSKCVVTGLEAVPAVPMVRDAIKFGVDSTKAGAGELKVTTSGPSGEELSRVVVKEQDRNPGVYDIIYTPTASGEHKVHLEWGSQNIDRSPLVFRVAEGSAISSEPVYPYGYTINLGLAADNRKKDIEAYAVLDDTTDRLKLKVARSKKGQYNLSFLPIQPGYYNVHVEVKGVGVAGSPCRIRYDIPPSPDKVKVVIDPRHEAYVNYPINFFIDTSAAGTGEIILRANLPKKAKEVTPEFKIKSHKDSTYSAQYVPLQPYTHQFEVLFAGRPVTGSPFLIRVQEKEPDMVHLLSRHLNLVGIGKAVDVYFKLAPGSNLSSIVSSVIGRRTPKEEVKIQEVDDDWYRAHFVASVADDFSLQVMHRGKHIGNSPFPIKVVGYGGFEPGVTLEEVENPSIVLASSPCNLIIPMNKPVSADEMEVEIDGPPEVSVSPTIKDDTHTTLAVTFQPDIAGDYLVHVRQGSEPIANSPFRIIVKPSISDASKCFVLEEDMPLFDETHSSPIKFRISTFNAGPGTLNITSRGPAKANVKIYDNSDGTYTCSFSPSITGEYNIDILWDDQHIVGSPYIVRFKQKKKKVITGLDLDLNNFRVNVPHRFKLHCEEVGDGTLNLAIKPPSAATIKVSDVGDSSYQVEILPKEEGHHELSVKYGGNHLAGSPFNITINKRGDASKCHMISSDVEHTDDDKDHVIFIVSTADAGDGKVTSYVENPKSGERTDVQIDKIEEDKYKVHFDLGDAAEYSLVIKYDGQNIEGSPFKLLFAEQSDPNLCKAEGNGLSFSQIGKETSFSVNTEGAGDGALSVAIKRSDGVEIVPTVEEVSEGEHEVRYTPSLTGEYKIHVKWSDTDIPNSPFTMKSFVSVNAANLVIEDPPKECFLGSTADIRVRVVEAMEEGGFVTMTAKHRETTIEGTVRKEGNYYICSFQPEKAAKYTIKILLNGEDVRGSPFKVIAADPPRPDKCQVYGPGIEDGYVGQEGNFTIEATKAGTGTLSVKVHGPRGAFRINMRRHPEDERKILVRYDPKYVGRYIINVMWSNQHVPGSPFTVNIREQSEGPEGDKLSNGFHSEESLTRKVSADSSVVQDEISI